MSKDEILNVIEAVIERANADGCEGCAFYDREEWAMPCAKCKRNCKDYWRRGEQDATD